MGLKEQVLEYLKERCEEEGEETNLGITRIASDLSADKDEVVKGIEALRGSGMIEYRSEAEELHVCPAVGPDDILKYKIVNLVKQKRRIGIKAIARLLGEESRKITGLVEELIEEEKIEFGGEGGTTWIEPVPLDKPESINPIYSSSPVDEVREAFQKIRLSPQDVLLEPGCGKAKNLILAAEEFGATGIGYETLDSVYATAKKNVEDRSLQNKILLRKQSFYELHEKDLERATVAYLFLTKTANQIVEPVLKQYSIKILTRMFDLPTPGKRITEQIRLNEDFNSSNQLKASTEMVKIIRKD